MRIRNIYSDVMQRCFYDKKIITNQVQRVAMNALIIGNCCLITTLFFVASTTILSIALLVSIVGSAILIDRNYRVKRG